MYGCQQVLINADKELEAVLEFVSGESNKLRNCGVYYARQMYFKTGKIVSKYDLHSLLKTNPHFQALYASAAQQTLTSVAESFKSFIGLLKGIKHGSVTQHGFFGGKDSSQNKPCPKMPGYRKNSLALIAYSKKWIKLEVFGRNPSPQNTSMTDGLLRFPLGLKVKAWFGLDAFYLPMPSNLDFATIKEVRILPRNGCFYAEFVYKKEAVLGDVDSDKVLGIDSGLNNWLTCVSNAGTSFIVDGLHLKSLNQWYNKRVATIKGNKPQGFWSKRLANITEKRNRQVRDAINKAARYVINHCLQNKIGNVIFGWNKGQRQEINLGRKTNQKFVQIPTARLKDRIAQLCEQYGIQFVETEESYTSKASFVDGDELPVFGSKPEGWKSSGKRVKRGLFKTKLGILLNADCNGAANILKKVAVKLGLNLSEISSGDLTAPLRVRLWTL